MVRTTVWAPPSLAGIGVWGPWTSLLSYIGDGCYQISYSEIGNALAKGRVRYTDYNTRKTVIKEFYKSIDIHTADVYGIIKVSFISFTTGVSVDVILQGIDCEPYSESDIQEPMFFIQEKCNMLYEGQPKAIIYCVKIGLSDKGIPITPKVTKINPIIEPIWKSIKTTLRYVLVRYSKKNKILLVKASLVTEYEVYRHKHKEVNGNSVKITVFPKTQSWSNFQDISFGEFKNVDMPLKHVRENHKINNTLTYNGIELDKETSFTVNKSWYSK